MDLLVRTLEDEILSSIEGNYAGEEEYTTPDAAMLSLLADHPSYLPLAYLYKPISIKSLLAENNELFNGFVKRQGYSLGFDEVHKINITTPLLVGVKSSKKEVSLQLEKALAEKKLKMDYVLDIEFFEFYENNMLFLKHLFNREFELLNPNAMKNLGLYKLISHMQKSDLAEFDYALRTLGNNSADIIDVLDINKEIVSKATFTAFMDTEKIHLQLGILAGKYQQNEFPLLLYFGYGNHNPFSRNIKGKDAANKRFNRLNALNGRKSDVSHIIADINKTSIKRKQSLLELIDDSQQNYPAYFKENFSYDARAKMYLGNLEIDKSMDMVLQIPEAIRAKSAALIAYRHFLMF